ncbi:MAG: radical SAM protein [Candidatus Eisenbacteria bacterium]
MKPGFTKYLKTFHYVSRNLIRREGVFPFYASFKVTSRCPLKCPHCYLAREAQKPDLDTAAAKRIIESLGSMSILVLTFEGGEPFLRDDLEELLHFSRRFPLFVSVVTSYPDISMKRYAHLSGIIDFLQISIDEGHGNLFLFDRLDEIRSLWHTRLCIQTVVTADTLSRMDEKVTQARENGCRILFLPLSLIYPEFAGFSPERSVFVRKVRMLKRTYPETVIAAPHFLRSYGRGAGCTSSSIVIDSDGSLFYPCHVLGTRPFNLLDGNLKEFLLSREASELRERMNGCSVACGWYQYFALSLRSVKDLPSDVLSALERINEKGIDRKD